LIGLLTSSHAGNVVVRRLLIGALAIPLLGLLIMMGARASVYTQSFGEALLAVVAMAVAIGLVLTIGRTLDRLDAARTASERAVVEREERLRDLIAQASDGIFIADLDGRYKEVNDAGCDMLGYRREELIGKNITDLIPTADIPRLQASRTLMLGGASTVDEWKARRSDGTYVPVEVSAKILPDGRWQALVRDISARKRVERAGQAMAEAATGAPESSLNAVLRTIGREARLAADAEYVALGLGDDVPPHPPAMINFLRVPIRSRGRIEPSNNSLSGPAPSLRPRVSTRLRGCSAPGWKRRSIRCRRASSSSTRAAWPSSRIVSCRLLRTIRASSIRWVTQSGTISACRTVHRSRPKIGRRPVR
jgi:PAS domain S-box-containing protein